MHKFSLLRQNFFLLWRTVGLQGLFSRLWSFFWMRFAGTRSLGRIATWLATWFTPPYKGRTRLARYSAQGYVALAATLYHDKLHLGDHVFIDDRVVIFQGTQGGSVQIGDRVHIYRDTYIETGQGGSLKIGANTHIQPRCQISAYKASIEIGSGVQIAPNCAFYPYQHSVAAGVPIIEQPLHSKGGIVIEDDVWLGYGVVVLDGVRIEKGAVIGAGAVVTRSIPAGAICAGVPARVVKMREPSPPNAALSDSRLVSHPS